MSSQLMTWTPLERVHMGAPAAEAVADEAARQGASRVFLLAGETLRRRTGEIATIEAALGARHAATWSGIAPHSPRSHVLAATLAARDAKADLIVTVGGGSVTDAGKIIALALKNQTWTYEAFDDLRNRAGPQGEVIEAVIEGPDVRVVCVPTTLSGGEFNTLAGCTDDITRQKQGYDHPKMAPVAVALDPAISRHTPEWVWLSTGVRAVDHAVETLASKQSNLFCDGVADSALRLLAEGLPRAKADPSDLDGRLRCQIGAWQSMIAILGGVPMGASHAIGHVLGGTCDVPHGYTSCVMSPYVQAWNAEDDASRQGRISDCLGAPGQTASQALDAFIRGLGMPRRLSEVGVARDQLDIIARRTLKDLWGRTNPRPIETADQVMEILERAF